MQFYAKTLPEKKIKVKNQYNMLQRKK